MLFQSLVTVALCSWGTLASKPPIRQVTVAQWRALNASVEGRLHGNHPAAAACFKHFDDNLTPVSHDDVACKKTQANWTKGKTGLSTVPGGQTETQWSGCQSQDQQCILSYEDPESTEPFAGNKTCYQGAVSQYFIDIRKPEDITAAYDFSSTTKTPLVVHNTGHDFMGRSTQPDSLSLWTHNLKTISYTEAFYPAGSSDKYTAITVGAGVQLGEAYKFARLRGKQVVGGTSSSVGYSGGYFASGGHSFLSPTKGLAVDNVLEVKVVVPNGGLITASRTQNKDVFFAVVGGGPSSIGVVLETTHRVYPVKPITLLAATFTITDKQMLKDYIDVVTPHIPSWLSLGYGGGISLSAVPGQTAGAVFVGERNILQVIEDFAPLFKFVSTLPLLEAKPTILPLPLPDIYSAFDVILGTSGEAAPFGQPILSGSRLIPTNKWNSERSIAKLKQVFYDYTIALTPKTAGEPLPGASVQLGLVTPFNTPASGYTAETPAWRTSAVHALGQVAWNWNSTAEYRLERETALDRGVDLLRKLAPSSGAYANEALPSEPNFEKTFWGTSNYKRLLEIKSKYDPESLLACWKCVGWQPESDRYRCYPSQGFGNYK